MENKGGRTPFFSVVLAVYNGLPFLQEALESVVAQTDADWEFIIVDDASTDGTPEVLSAFAARDRRIRVIRNAVNRHIGASANVGIAQACGRWIARIDADDRYHPRFLERVRAHASRMKSVPFFVSAWVAVIDEDGKKILDARLPPGHVVRRMMPTENFIYHVATAFPRGLWEQVGGYPEHLKRGIDPGLWKKFFEAGTELHIIPEVLADYRIHDANLTSVARSKEEGTPSLRQRREWCASIYLKQKMLGEARKELRLLAREFGWSLKNRVYFFLSYLPPSLVYFMMWEVRSRLR